MDSKLTLSVNKSIAEKAKLYARSQGRSLSDLVESYFKLLTEDEVEFNLPISSKLKSMKGAFKVDAEYNYKKELSDSLSKKYLK